MRILPIAAVLIGLPMAAALADAPPPDNAKPLSQLLESVEGTPNFGYVDEVEWEHGNYQIEYYTKTGTKKEIYINPVTGKRLHP